MFLGVDARWLVLSFFFKAFVLQKRIRVVCENLIKFLFAEYISSVESLTFIDGSYGIEVGTDEKFDINIYFFSPLCI